MGRTRTTTRTGRTRSDPRPDRRSAGVRRASGACVSRARHLGSDHRALACGPRGRRSPLWTASSAKQRAVASRGGAGRDRADEFALRRAVTEAAGSSARRRRAVPRVRVDDVPGAAPTRSAHEAADYGAHARDSRIHGAPGDWRRTRCGAGTSPGCRRRCADRTCTSTSSWTSGAVALLAGASPNASRQTSPLRSSRRSCAEGNVDPRGLVLHSDNGNAMRGSTMISTLQWLGVIPSFSRPHVSDDNPYSEALFRTLKHTPAYPRLPFADLASANRWVTRFVDWYNGTHRHSAIRYVTPDQRHHGRERAVLASRHELYERMRRANPERWSGSTRNWLPVGTRRAQPRTRTALARQLS